MARLIAAWVLVGSSTVAASPAQARGAPAELAFASIFESAPGPLRPSERLVALAGQRVRMVGFMARLEDPPKGAFWLVPRPTECDESGAGIGDLPPDAVRVVVRSASGKPISFVPGALAVTGVLEVGNLADEDGRVSAVRVVLDRPSDMRPHAAAKSSRRTTRTMEFSR